MAAIDRIEIELCSELHLENRCGTLIDVEVHATDPFAELALHVLAHIKAPGPFDLHDARYTEWTAARTPDLSRLKVQPDAALLSGAWSAEDAQLVLRCIDLHHDLAGFVRTKDRAVAELLPEDVDDPELLGRLQNCSPLFIELLHAQLGQVVQPFAGLLAVHIAPAVAAACPAVAEHVTHAIELAPGLADARIELAWALGPRARVSARRILVGAPAPWNGLEASAVAVVAMYGEAVRRLDTGDPIAAQWSALLELADVIGRDPAGTLRDAHAKWSAEIDIAPLCHVLAHAGQLSASDADTLTERPEARAEMLYLLARARGQVH